MKIAILNDTHFGVRGDSQILSDYQEKFFSNVFFPTLEEHGIKDILHLGDVFDRRKYINFLTLNRAKVMFFTPLKNAKINMIVGCGNHDVYYKNTNHINSLTELLGEYDNITIYSDDPVELEYDNTTVMLSPWINSTNYEASMQAFKDTKAQILFGHFEFQGFEVMKGHPADHGLSRTDFAKFDAVYSGHFHHPSAYGNIEYLGAPYEMTWTDFEGRRGFHIFDTETRVLTFIPNRYKIFHKVDYDDTDLSPLDIEDLDVDVLGATYVKVIIKNKTNPYLFDLFLDKLQLAVPADIRVIEDQYLEMGLDEELLDEAQDTVSLLMSYVNGLDLKVSKNLVEKCLIDLYQEAIAL